MTRSLVVVGCGAAGLAVAREALRRGREVVGTTRDPERVEALRAAGIVPLVLGGDPAATLARIARGADVVVTFPPDGHSDAALAPRLREGRLVYVSSTGVYGAATGRVDEDTPVDAASPAPAARLAAEACWRAEGATVLRAPGLYGPGRGLHLRLLRGEHRLPGDGLNVVSRLHLEDLALFCLAALEGPRGGLFTVADDAPVPQLEVVDWLCERLKLPRPPFVPAEQVHPSLRGDRRVANARAKRTLGVSLRYPSYREGFSQCLRADGLVR